MPSRARTHRRHPRRAAAVVAALAVLTTVGGCGGGGDEDVATGPAADAVSDVIGPVVPDSPGDGCGRHARTDPLDTGPVGSWPARRRCPQAAPLPAPPACGWRSRSPSPRSSPRCWWRTHSASSPPRA